MDFSELLFGRGDSFGSMKLCSIALCSNGRCGETIETLSSTCEISCFRFRFQLDLMKHLFKTTIILLTGRGVVIPNYVYAHVLTSAAISGNGKLWNTMNFAAFLYSSMPDS